MRLFHLSVMAFLVLFVCATPAMAETGDMASGQPVSLTSAQQIWVGRIEQKLMAIHTIRARFRQISSSGQVETGTLFLQRPPASELKSDIASGSWGRMRFAYDPPSQLLLVANQGKVVFEDKSIEQITSMPLERTPLGLLLRQRPRFSGDVRITAFEEKQDHILLHVVKADNPGEGVLTLYFRLRPLALEGWDLIDAQGHKTVLRLGNIEEDVALPEDIFVLPKEE